jgi:predicted RNase H-like nuclease (RuvC/YqgF family)
MKSISEAPSSEDLKDISEVILLNNQKSIQKLQDRQEECDKIIIEKDEEISRLRNHNQKLLAKMMKSKEKKGCFQKFEQENQGIKEKLTKKEEENPCLRNLNHKCYRAVCILGHRLQDSGQTGVTGTFPTQCHLDGEVLSV